MRPGMRRVKLDPYQAIPPEGFWPVEPIPPEPDADWPEPFGASPGAAPPAELETRAELRARAKIDRLAARRAHLLRFLAVAGVIATWLGATVVLLLLGKWEAAYYVGMGPIWLAIGVGLLWLIGKAIWIVTGEVP